MAVLPVTAGWWALARFYPGSPPRVGLLVATLVTMVLCPVALMMRFRRVAGPLAACESWRAMLFLAGVPAGRYLESRVWPELGMSMWLGFLTAIAGIAFFLIPGAGAASIPLVPLMLLPSALAALGAVDSFSRSLEGSAPGWSASVWMSAWLAGSILVPAGLWGLDVTLGGQSILPTVGSIGILCVLPNAVRRAKTRAAEHLFSFD